jgi:choline dehydrogenase
VLSKSAELLHPAAMLIGTQTDYEYVIIGGGSAGCVAAARLSAEFKASVLVLEAGAVDSGLLLHIPSGFTKLLAGKKYITCHRTVPQPQLGGRELLIPQAKVLGGGSSINAQAYMRGRIADYDTWGAIAGTDLWSWQRILPHFRSMEGNQTFRNDLHGDDGPLKVSRPAFTCELSHVYVRTLQGMGAPFTTDFNNGTPGGVGYLQVTASRGRRCSATDAFLHQIPADAKLRVQTDARVVRIIVENNRAVGVEYLHRGVVHTVRTDGEILLAAGSFVSPQILLLSGIGPAEQLRNLGIPVAQDLPGVGANLQDHTAVSIDVETHGIEGYSRQHSGLRMLRNGAEYLLFRSGRAATNGVEACSFHVPEDGTGDPVVQIYCVPSIGFMVQETSQSPAEGMSLGAVLLRPRSIGWVRLRSVDPADPPLVNPNYLAEPEDVRHLLQGLLVARDIMRAQPLGRYIGRELVPGADVTSDADLIAFLRRAAKTDYHPVGTCRMGAADDRDAVVGADLAVRGIAGLRVIDASAMPKLISANTNAPTMALAHRAVSLMRAARPGPESAFRSVSQTA